MRIDGTYAFVGLQADDTENEEGWADIMPYDPDEKRWLQELGPGRLVFIPDAYQPHRGENNE